MLPRVPFLRRLALLAIAAAIPLRVGAQDAGFGTVAGRISAAADSGAAMPVAGALISATGTSLRTTSDAAGRFVLERVPVGTATLRIRLLGYRSAERSVRVEPGDTARVDVVLQPEPQLLAPIRADARPEDLEMFTTRPSVGTIAMRAEAMAGVPKVGEADVVRVVQLLPGVVSRNDFNTGLNVRGGEADQNLILLDGYPIYNPFHLGGLFSTFMDATVGGIELLTGAFPARFGGRLSSVLDVRSAGETRPGVNTTLDVSALGASAKVGGIVGNGRGMWSVAARRTYADAVTSVFTNNVFPYHFRDIHARGAYALPHDLRLSATAYLGRDVLDANLAEFETDTAPSRATQGTWAFDWGNRVVGLTLARELVEPRVPLLGWRLGESGTLEQRVSSSEFSTLLDLGDGAFSQRNTISDVRITGSLAARGPRHDGSIGYEVATHRIRYASASAQTGTTEFDIAQRPISAALWIDDLWRVSPRWLVESGVRAEALTGRQWAALSPRLSVKFFATPTLALTAGAGRVTQWLHSLAGDGPLRYFDVWLASDSLTPVATAWHYVVGAERRIGEAGSLRLEGYYKDYQRTLEANWSEDSQIQGDEFFVARGTSYGVDLLARWSSTQRLGGWISYSYGVSARTRDGVRWAPGHDRRHDLDVVGTWRVARYRVGARFGFATGTPYTPIVGEIARRVYDPALDRWGTGDPRILVESLGGARHGARFPATHRLDLDVSREFRWRGANVAPYVSVVNAYNAQSVFVYLYDYSTDDPTRRAISQFPILPSLGVRVDF